jgi:hypothetical protein
VAAAAAIPPVAGRSSISNVRLTLLSGKNQIDDEDEDEYDGIRAACDDLDRY